MKPLIGISCSIDATDSGAQKEFLNDSYFKAIERAGGLPVIIPNTTDPELQIEIAKRLDGVIISGGPDMDPRRYGSRVNAKVSKIYPRRDAAEFSLISYVINETDLPILGICRGIQSINAVMGGDLIVDLPTDGYLIHSMSNIYPRAEEAHDIIVEKDTKLFEILGKEEIGVNSFHHQAVKTPAPGFRVTAYSIPDRVIEAIEMPGERFVVGVQWHPEEMINHEAHQNLFRALVRAAAKQK
ncbi:MAG: gamma-glutamyl-gamma-aminobutyrate hydrolase family protein [Clostridia bacterium]|nr:gamma-glutamyl-gamma-aminobutyrate hydrolase family protein [Clostridia bacterium]